MTKQEFLAANQPSNLQIVNKDMYGDESLIITGISFDDVICKYGRTPIKFTTPIIRPLDSLVKECVQADYNNGKSFIPIVELLNIFNKNANSIYAPNSPSLEIDYYHNRQAEYFCAWYKVTEDVRMNILTLSSKFQYNYPFWTIKYLLEWHFWPNMPESEEVVLVTDEFNPYK